MSSLGVSSNGDFEDSIVSETENSFGRGLEFNFADFAADQFSKEPNVFNRTIWWPTEVGSSPDSASEQADAGTSPPNGVYTREDYHKMSQICVR
jgi:hypothetical protein